MSATKTRPRAARQKHLIKNYDQVKARLEVLNRDFNARRRDYYFAIGDLFNENVPPGTSSRDYTGEARGTSAAQYNRQLSREIERLLEETETDITPAHLGQIRSTARAWPKSERHYDVSFGVYVVLRPLPHRKMMRDGLTQTQATALIRGVPEDKVAEEHRERSRRERLKTYNRTQTIRIGINCLRSVVENDDGTPLTGEQLALIGEAYATLDAYCDRKGVNFDEEDERDAA